MKIKLLSAFTGIGSPEIALKNIGLDIDVVGISEVDRYALLAYDAIHCDKNEIPLSEKSKDEMISEMSDDNIAYNFSTGSSEMPKKMEDVKKLYLAHKRTKNYGDIRGIDESILPNFDLFTYSFPCKNISIAGTQDGLSKGSGTQSSLLWECERIIRAKKPKFLLMENVKNLVGKKHIHTFERWINILEKMGYESKYKVLNACDFGLPQNRERVMMVSVLNDKCNDLPIGVKTSKNVSDICEPHNEVKESLFYKKPYIEFMDKIPIPKQLNHIGKLGGKNHSNSRVYSSVGYSPTLNSMNGGNRQPKIHFGEVTRRLTPLECWRLQGLSDVDFMKADKILPDSKMYERSGRGIAIPMLEEIFKTIDF